MDPLVVDGHDPIQDPNLFVGVSLGAEPATDLEFELLLEKTLVLIQRRSSAQSGENVTVYHQPYL